RRRDRRRAERARRRGAHREGRQEAARARAARDRRRGGGDRGVPPGLPRLGRRDGQDLLRWGPMAVADFAQEWFETPLLAAVVAARGIQGMLAGPWSA